MKEAISAEDKLAAAEKQHQHDVAKFQARIEAQEAEIRESKRLNKNLKTSNTQLKNKAVEVPETKKSAGSDSEFLSLQRDMKKQGEVLSKLLSNVNFRKMVESGDDPTYGNGLHISEIGDPGPIERVSENDFVDKAQFEAFANEPVKIMVQLTNDSESLDIITPSVNGQNQPIIRGVEIWVKRKYVEALARCKVTTYKQVENPLDRSDTKMMDATVPGYNFTVTEDRNPIGAHWLKAILAEQ